MRALTVLISSHELRQDGAEVRLVEDDHVVETLPA